MNLKTLDPAFDSKFSSMADNQSSVSNLNGIINELMNEYCQGVEEVHLEPPSETVVTAEPENQPTVEETEERERVEKRHRTVRHAEEEETEDEKAFVSEEAHDLWNRLLFDKDFVSERRFEKLIPSFSELIEKKVGSFFANTKRLGLLLWPENFTQTWWV